MVSLVEVLAGDDEQVPSPCQHGNIVVGHACYCHHPDGPRKCPKWSQQLPYHECKLYSPRKDQDGRDPATTAN